MPYLPAFIAPTRYADPVAALAQVQRIYDQQIAHLREAMRRYVAGETLPGHVRACYPFVRVHTETVARAILETPDISQLSYGFVAGPGRFETTLTRPDLYGNYYLEQFRLLVIQTAWKIDKLNDYKLVRGDIAAVKVLSERVMVDIASKAIHLHGALGVSNEMLFGEWLLWGHALGLADGPSEVHKLTLAKQLMRAQPAADAAFPSQHIPSGAVRAAEQYAAHLRLPGHRRGWVPAVS